MRNKSRGRGHARKGGPSSTALLGGIKVVSQHKVPGSCPATLTFVAKECYAPAVTSSGPKFDLKQWEEMPCQV